MDHKFDVVALGELLIDFTQNGISGQGNPLLEANPGGAPCNVLAMLQKLGKSTAFVGKVGDDMFGRQLREVVGKAGIDLTYLVMDPAAHTTLAFVQTFANGDRDFSFYRDPGADMLLTANEVPEDVIAQSRIFHFGTLSMTHSGVREATPKAVVCAKNSGVLVPFDPTLCPPLWTSLENAREQISWGLSQCDVLKIADNELALILRLHVVSGAEIEDHVQPLLHWSTVLFAMKSPLNGGRSKAPRRAQERRGIKKAVSQTETAGGSGAQPSAWRRFK